MYLLYITLDVQIRPHEKFVPIGSSVNWHKKTHSLSSVSLFMFCITVVQTQWSRICLSILPDITYLGNTNKNFLVKTLAPFVSSVNWHTRRLNYISNLFSVLLKLYKHNYSECLCNYLIYNTLKMHTYTNFSVKKSLTLLFSLLWINKSYLYFQLYKHHDPEYTFWTLWNYLIYITLKVHTNLKLQTS